MRTPTANPYSPGAGTPPPHLTGRQRELDLFDHLIARLSAGRSEKSIIMTGLRGVGKTVLLNRFETIAAERNWVAAMYELRKDEPMTALLAKLARRVLLELDSGERRTDKVLRALRTLKSFTVGVAGITFAIEVDPLAGRADSGDLVDDLIDLLVAVGEAAADQGTGVVLLLDEVQYLGTDDYAALIMALHRVSQRQLPLCIAGAGLPIIPKLSGEARSYAERMFHFPRVDRLDDEAARTALIVPAEHEGVEYQPAALDRIMEITSGYPYFLQEYGKQVWDHSREQTISASEVEAVHPLVLAYLDESFFEVRISRTTDSQRRYLRAMSELGDGPYLTRDIAERMGRTPNAVSPVRDELIRDALIYAPRRGSLDFTVPQFADFMRRWVSPDEDTED